MVRNLLNDWWRSGMESSVSNVRSAAREVARRNSFWVSSLARDRDLPRPLSSWLLLLLTADSESISWDLIRDPSSEASSKASLSLCSCNLRRTDGFFLFSSEELWSEEPFFFLLFLSKINEAQWEIGFHSERCIKAGLWAHKLINLSFQKGKLAYLHIKPNPNSTSE